MKRCMGCMKLYDDNVNVCPHCGYVEDSEVYETQCLPPHYKLQNRYILGRIIGIGGLVLLILHGIQHLKNVLL